jgi:enoyl-CoA hydratase/carnithine racemase
VPVLSIDGAVARIMLNRPAHRNRLEDADLHALLAHFAQIQATPAVRVLVLSANTQGQSRPVFCAGYDIGGFDGTDHDPHLFERIPDALAALRPITLCVLNGSVYGGATDLFLACDLRVALRNVEFRMPAAALGLHYYPSGLQRYVKAFGINGAKRAFLTARPLSAHQLEAMGCLEAIFDVEALDTGVQRLVQEIASLAPLAAQTTKRSLDDIAAGREVLAVLRERQAQTAASEDFLEGRRAFQEKRKPHFSGR